MSLEAEVIVGKSTIETRVYELLWALKGGHWRLGLCILAAMGAAFEIFGESRDFAGYAAIFDDMRWAWENTFEESRFEPGFMWISHFLVLMTSSNYIVYGLLVFFALWIKSSALSYRGAAVAPTTVLVAYYLARFLPLHEFTQIRAAIAVSFVFLVFVFVERKRYPEAALTALIALSFHTSALFVIPAIVVRPLGRIVTSLLVPVIFLLISGFGSWLLENLDWNVKTLQLYQEQGFGERANPFSLLVLLDVCLLAFGFVFWSRATSTMQKVLLIETVGISVFYGLLAYPVVAFRVYEIYATILVFYLYDAITHDKIHLIGASVYIALCIVLYPTLYLFYDPLFS